MPSPGYTSPKTAKGQEARRRAFADYVNRKLRTHPGRAEGSWGRNAVEVPKVDRQRPRPAPNPRPGHRKTKRA